MRKTGLGVQGENEVVGLLKSRQYEILERNYISRFGEIDIIARNEEFICFIEVKTRSKISENRPEYSIDISKQNRIIKTADLFLSENESHIGNLQPRFDCAFVLFDEKENAFKVNLCENAFSVG